MASIREDIVEIIKRATKPRKPDLSDDKAALLDVGLDSLDYATAIMEVEEKYKLKVTEKDIEAMRSLKDIVDFVETRAGSST
jgi:acyl carrier protein